MKKKYCKALVIGKFQPLHKGHMALIDFARSQAEKVVVCLTAHANEQLSLAQRLGWLESTYEQDSKVSICAVEYDPSRLTESSESDIVSSLAWSDYLREYFGHLFDSFDVIVGSERYVQYMADYLGIACRIYDEERTLLSISATAIKSDIVRYWDYLAPAVKRSYVRHICICGSESTGKSTTCKRLEEECSFVTMIPEIGRCLVGKSEICSEETLKTIFKIHNALLNSVKADPPTPIVLWDTDNITTLSYYQFLYPDVTLSYRGIPKADKYFFFESNLPFQDDGTRFKQQEALQLSLFHKATYAHYGIDLQIVSANDRQEVVRQYILEELARLKNEFIKK